MNGSTIFVYDYVSFTYIRIICFHSCHCQHVDGYICTEHVCHECDKKCLIPTKNRTGMQPKMNLEKNAFDKSHSINGIPEEK